MKRPAKLIMMRHGQSEWNKQNLFTGWVDIPLSPEGIRESIEGGKKIADIPIDVIFVSSLIRSHMTAMLAMAEHKGGKVPYFLHPNQGKLEEWAQIYSEETKKKCIPVISAWQLNERMYGKLQGLNKQKMREEYGEEQVKIWRRSFDVAPPEGESLAMTAARSIPYFKEMVIPYLEEGNNVFIAAHGNSLRSIVMYLDSLSKEEVINLELGTGVPIIYNYRSGAWKKEI
ncbi:MAG TPA: 2,3-bisphosphoglycerate-dependent phosphoglycerate mutase [Rhabdochlamydiaceae bacterium]|nr:2,3-bisphosphoglycerate-dependent phosphoglycerate mutase [Rhabdochlamydiaceae bacterium]